MRPSVLAASALVVKYIHFGGAKILFSAVVNLNIYKKTPNPLCYKGWINYGAYFAKRFLMQYYLH